MRTVILSCDDSNSIRNYPYVAWAWNELGWNTHLFYLGKHSVLIKEFKKVRKGFNVDRNQIQTLSKIEGYENDIVLAAAKLFGGFCYWDNRVLMTADIDIVPVRDFWQPLAVAEGTSGDKAISRYLAMGSDLWRKKMETGEKTFLDDEMKKMLDGNDEFKDKDAVNRTIAMNKYIIDNIIGSSCILNETPADAHMKLDETCETNNLKNIKNILKTNFNKIPGWL